MTGTDHDYLHEKITWTRFLGYLAAFLITFTVVDLFQVKESAQSGSFDKFNRYFASTYPHCIPQRVTDIPGCIFSWTADRNRQRDSSPMVSVVLWTDDMLIASSRSWPLRMEEHARVLETILPMQPKGVLVDLFFLDDPENRGDDSLQDLIDVICDYHEASEGGAGPRLYLTDPSSTIGPRTTTKLIDGVEKVCGLNLGGSNQSDTVTFVSAILSDSPSRIYSKRGAATQIFSAESALEIEDFHIFWSHNSHQLFLDDERCTTAASVFPTNIPEVFREISIPAIEAIPLLNFSRTSRSTAVPCPYAPVISAHSLHCLRATPPDGADDARRKELEDCGMTKDEYSSVRQMVQGKYVLYGAELHGVGDIYDVPIHDGYRLSGIFTHAMALDNLLETDGRVHFVSKKKGILYYVFSAFLATILFISARCVFFDYWPRVERRLLELPPKLGPLLELESLSKLKSFLNLESLLKIRKLASHVVLLFVEFLYWLCVVIAAGAILIVSSWVVYLLAFLFEPFRFGILNWVGILLVSGLLSAWVKMPFAEALSEIIRTLYEVFHPVIRILKSYVDERLGRTKSTP